jgi:hypothetical protein
MFSEKTEGKDEELSLSRPDYKDEGEEGLKSALSSIVAEPEPENEEEGEEDGTYIFLDPRGRLTRHLQTSLEEELVTLDGTKMHHDIWTCKRDLVLVLDEARRKLVHCMQQGKILLIALGKSCPDFLGLLNDTYLAENEGIEMVQEPMFNEPISFLPRGFMLNQGRAMTEHPWPEQLFRRVDRETAHAPAVVDPSFQIIITTEFRRDQLDEELFDGEIGLPPKKYFSVIDEKTSVETIYRTLLMVEPEQFVVPPEMLE